MARNFPKSSLVLFIFFFFFINRSANAARRERETFISKREKQTQFRVYLHDISSGTNPTIVQVAAGQSTGNSPTKFGAVFVIDNALTEGPELNSTHVGRAQGIYASAAQSEVDILVAMNFVFMEGKYNGSTITILGRNAVSLKVREMPVIGGSGVFRFARGYVMARTIKSDPSKEDFTIEYTVDVLHY